ncbi:unnamed protein product [Cylicocyclus nassatus]|uniref:FAD dependent oxidoreductase domain-containing protein n=1 Tax=Cylicocyclus nassatus TaxID=53992 RepID=A0AA36M9P0_CYLNA|nr:unnamed protein product [Cylicocyclus nassatus]
MAHESIKSDDSKSEQFRIVPLTDSGDWLRTRSTEQATLEQQFKEELMTGNICVIGAGIIGLSSAVAIQENVPDVKVTIVTSDFSPNLTSDIAAGLIEPYLSGIDEESVNRWTRETIKHIRKYMKDYPNGGAQEMSGYRFSQNPDTPSWISLMDNVHVLSPEEVEQKHPLPQKSGLFYTTLYLQPTKYLQFLHKKFLSNGGVFVKKRIERFEELGSDYACIVNCAGLAAKKLVDDHLLHPIRGQIIRVRCPAVKHFFIDDQSYVLLNDDCIILGGTADADEWNTAVDGTTAKRIMEYNKRNVPALETCEVISHHVGLRPGRRNVRLELEQRQVPVVHNYGHGGSGVTLFWGCALDVAKIVKRVLRGTEMSKM